jgi:endonuclease III
MDVTISVDFEDLAPSNLANIPAHYAINPALKEAFIAGSQSCFDRFHPPLMKAITAMLSQQKKISRIAKELRVLRAQVKSYEQSTKANSTQPESI